MEGDHSEKQLCVQNKNDLLNQKSHRSKNKHKHQNKKRILQNQLEFYFSDINLLNDKFLRNLITKDVDKGVDINIILNFNKIKSIIEEIEGLDTEADKIKFVKKAVENSKKIKIYINKIVRVEKFEIKKLNLKEIDKKIIYVQNIPNVTHEILIEIFGKFGKIKHVSIPKFSDSKLSKGFAFITFENTSDVEKAIRESNNTIPKEFISTTNTCSLDPLSVISKNEWLLKKEEFKQLKQELINENKDIFADCFIQDSKSLNALTPGTLVKLTNLPLIKFNKFDIKLWIANFVEPAYVDYMPDQNMCIVRFCHKILAESFVNKSKNDEDFKFLDTKLDATIMASEQEIEYFEKVQKMKDELAKKKKSKKVKTINNTNNIQD